MAEKFDLVVIGTGTGASAVAHACRSAGWKVAIVDSRPFGGTCALRGCDPKKVLVGGGYISFEFAHVAARAGAEVTIIHRGERPLPRFDPDLVDLLVERTRKLGVRVELRTAVKGIERTADVLTVHASTTDEHRPFQADLVVHGAGRVPEIDDMDLAAAGVEWDERGVKVNEYLQSVSNPSVYAAGDAAASGGPPLTPVAGYEGGIVAANLLNGNKTTADYNGIPSVAFTVPSLATVGLQEATARQQGLHMRVHMERTSGWYSSRRIAEEYSAFKVLIEEGTERILGAHLLGPHTEETINLFALTIRARLSARDLKETIFAYPTHASDIAYML